MADDEAQLKNEERERKKAEVRKRLEEQGKSGKKAKKGFLTPERKKKLRKLLMMKAAEDLKQQQFKKEQERQKALADRIVPLPDVDSIEDSGKLQQIYADMWKRVCELEDQKYDINYFVKEADQQINQLTIEVNDLRGKYVKPTLKKVSKYDNKFKKMSQKQPGEKQDFRANLKVVKNTENVIDEIMNKKKKDDKPEWTKKDDLPTEDREVPEEPPVAEEEREEDAEEPEVADEEGELDAEPEDDEE